MRVRISGTSEDSFLRVALYTPFHVPSQEYGEDACSWRLPLKEQSPSASWQTRLHPTIANSCPFLKMIWSTRGAYTNALLNSVVTSELRRGPTTPEEITIKARAWNHDMGYFEEAKPISMKMQPSVSHPTPATQLLSPATLLAQARAPAPSSGSAAAAPKPSRTSKPHPSSSKSVPPKSSTSRVERMVSKPSQRNGRSQHRAQTATTQASQPGPQGKSKKKRRGGKQKPHEFSPEMTSHRFATASAFLAPSVDKLPAPPAFLLSDPQPAPVAPTTAAPTCELSPAAKVEQHLKQALGL